MKRIIALTWILFSALSLSAQKGRTITGVITDDNNETVTGVTVLNKATKKGVITDQSGKYLISNVSEGDTLVFSFIGMEQQERVVGTSAVINVRLQSGVMLDEVVVLAYGAKVSKTDDGGSSSVLKLQDIEKSPVLSATEALMGKIAGVNILSNSGEPGSGMTFEIRGRSTLSGSGEPLYVIDGEPIIGGNSSMAGGNTDALSTRSTPNPLANYNVNDFESIEVLKDAAATAIYGSRGANGVVLITTKQGKAGKTVVTYSHRSDFNWVPKKLDVLNTRDYLSYLYYADATMAGIRSDYQWKDRFRSLQDALDRAAIYPDTNWQNEVYDMGYSQDHQLAISGGGANGDRFRISGGYTDMNTFIRNANYRRGSLRFRYSRPLSKKVTLDINSSYNIAWQDQLPQSSRQGSLMGSTVLGALAFKPIRTAYDEEGGLDDEESGNNPVLLRELVDNKTEKTVFNINMKVDYQIFKDLTFSVRGTFGRTTAKRDQYWPRGTYTGDTYNGQAYWAYHVVMDYLTDYMLNYSKKKGRHSIYATAAYSWQQSYDHSANEVSRNFPNDKLTFHNMQSALNPSTMTTGYTDHALASFIGRAIYSYDRRYVFTATGRYDGSSRLASGHKWDFFPSASFAWNVTNEKFMRQADRILSNLKLRASWGITGNESVGVGDTQAQLALGNVVFGQENYKGYVQSSIGNSHLKWERTEQFNVGLDIGLFRRKLDITVDAYYKTTKDLLLHRPLPGSSTFGSYMVNGGKIRNRGVDMEISGRVISRKDMDWSLNGNISFCDNKIMSLGEHGNVYGPDMISHGTFALNQPVNVGMVGSEVGAFYGYQTAGVFQNWAEVNAHPDKLTAFPGKVVFVDRNGDGKINENDKTVIGSSMPDFTYGFGTTFNYKSLSVTAVFVGSVGNDLLNLNLWSTAVLNKIGNSNVLADAYENRWQGSGTGNDIIPAPTYESSYLNQRLPDWMVEDASYLRLQNLTVAYSLDMPKGWGVRNAKFFVTGTNLFTVTDYSGYDPAISAFGDSALNQGIDLGTIPSARTVSIGIDLTF